MAPAPMSAILPFHIEIRPEGRVARRGLLVGTRRMEHHHQAEFMSCRTGQQPTAVICVEYGAA